MRRVPFHQHFANFLLSTTLFFLSMPIFWLFTTGEPFAIDIPAPLLHLNLVSANPSNTIYPSLITICCVNLTISRCFICTVLSMLFACAAPLPTSHGHTFVLTIDVSLLNEYNEKCASLLVPMTTASARQSYLRQPAPHMSAMSRPAHLRLRKS